MIELRTHTTIPDGPLRDEWDALVDDDPDATIFHTPGYLSVWLDVLGEGIAPQVATLHRDDRLVGVVPAGRGSAAQGPVRLLGGDEVTDYLGPVARPADREEVAAAYLHHLAAAADVDELDFAGLSVDSGWVTILAAAAERAGFLTHEDNAEAVCPRVDLADGYDAYLDALPGKQRHELRRKARKLAQDAGGLEMVEAGVDEMDERLDQFFAMAAGDETGKASFFQREIMRDFFRALARRFAADGVFRLHLLEVGGQPGAASVSLVHGGEWGLYNSAFDETLRTMAPGMVQVGQLIEVAASEGNHVFDLLRGDESYKYRFGAVDRQLRRLTLRRSDPAAARS